MVYHVLPYPQQAVASVHFDMTGDLAPEYPERHAYKFEENIVAD